MMVSLEKLNPIHCEEQSCDRHCNDVNYADGWLALLYEGDEGGALIKLDILRLDEFCGLHQCIKGAPLVELDKMDHDLLDLSVPLVEELRVADCNIFPLINDLNFCQVLSVKEMERVAAGVEEVLLVLRDDHFTHVLYRDEDQQQVDAELILSHGLLVVWREGLELGYVLNVLQQPLLDYFVLQLAQEVKVLRVKYLSL